MTNNRRSHSPRHSLSPLWRWGVLIVRAPWTFLLVPLIICIVLIPLAANVTHHLTSVGWTPESADSHRVQTLIEQDFGRATTNHYILFSDPSGELHADDRTFRLDVERAVRPFRNDPDVAAVYTWGSTRNQNLNDTLISQDRTMSLAVLVMDQADAPGSGGMDKIHSTLDAGRLGAKIGGWPATAETFLDLARDDLARAEIVTLPVTLVLLVVLFGGVIAAGLPVILAALSMIVTLAVLALLSRVTLVNVFSVNAVTMLGLAVGVDYALIMVSRFREESASTPVAESIPRVVATAGRAVLIAGSTVAIGLLGLVLFGVPAAISTGLAGASVVLACVLLSLTALPATFVLFGHRIGRRRRWATPRPKALQVMAGRMEHWREHHPWPVIVTCLIVLIALSLPLGHIVTSSPTMTILPRDSDARIVYDTIAEDFPNATLSPITMVVKPRSGSMMNPQNLGYLQTLTKNLARTPGVINVDSVWGYMPPGITPDTYATSLLLEPEMVKASSPFLTRSAALVSITPDPSLDAEGRRALVTNLRQDLPAMTGRDLTVLIGGDAALDLDLMQQVRDRAPLVVTAVLGLTFIALFIQFRSVFIPLKAILLNLCSLGASFGALVWIFQDGHFSRFLGFEPTGYTVVLIPILMFCFLFGLSMDFEVIMLSRIREAWTETGDNTRAIDIGLHRSAGIVTSSAVVMLIVFAAFSTSELQVIQSLGVGLGIAVVIDATIIRLLLLPATMQVMGRWNWWVPTFGLRSTRRSRMIAAPHDTK